MQETQYPGRIVSNPGGPGWGIGVQQEGTVCIIGDSTMLVQRRSEKGKELLLKSFYKFNVLYKPVDDAGIRFQECPDQGGSFWVM